MTREWAKFGIASAVVLALGAGSTALEQTGAEGSTEKADLIANSSGRAGRWKAGTTTTSTCTAGTLQGVYAVHLTGKVFGQPYSAVGFQFFDGEGRTWGTGTEANPVVTDDVSIEGSYTVNSDCSGQLLVKGKHLGEEVDEHTIDFYLSLSGERAFLAVTGTDFRDVPAEEMLPADTITVSGVMDRLSNSEMACDAKTIRGVYALQGSGEGYGLAVGVAGQATFDGEGRISGRLSEVVNGMVDEISFEGTYTIARDCSGTWTATFKPERQGSLQPVHNHVFDLYLSGGGSRFFTILTSTSFFDDLPDEELPTVTTVSGVGERL